MTDVRRTYNGKWELRWREGGRGSRRHSRTFDRKSDATNYEAWLRRRRQLGQAAVPDDVKLGEFVETYWQLHAIPNLSPATRTLYRRVWALHVLPRLGDYGVRELTPKRLTRFRAELEKSGVGTATIVKAMTIVQSILSFAVSEELVEYNAAASVTKPRYERAREPHIFLPADVEADPRQARRPPRPHPRLHTRLQRAPTRGGRLPPHLERRRRTGDPLRRYQAPPDPAHAAAEAPRRRPERVVPRVGPADWQSAGVPSPRRRLLERRTTGATGAGEPGRASPSASAGIARARTLHAPERARQARGRETYARAT